MWTLLILIAQTSSAWTVSKKVDPVTDRLEVETELRGEGGSLSFMCTRGGGQPVLLVEPTGFLGGGIGRHEWRDIVFRFDDAPPTKTRWKYVDTYAVSPSAKQTIKTLKGLLSHKRLVVRTTRYDHSTLDIIFNLAGSEAAMRDASNTCGYLDKPK